MKTKLFSLFAAVCCAVTMHAEIYSGDCGEHLTWTLNTADSTLVVSGYGDMNLAYQEGYETWRTYDRYMAIKSVSLPNGLTSIARSAFGGCKNLKTITIPENVTTVGAYAFELCSSLTSIVWNARNCQPEKDEYGYSYNFFDNTLASHITSFVFGNQVEIIPDNLCSYMSALQAIVIPNSVTTIGIAAFYDCSSLVSVTIGNNVNAIGRSAFVGCRSLQYIGIPNSVTYIGQSAFASCRSLAYISLGNGVQTIEGGAFYHCSSLSSITLPSSLKRLGEIEGSKKKDAGVFQECTGLSSITIPANVDTIGYDMFSECSALTSVTIQNPQAICGEDMFTLCDSLKTVTAPASAFTVSTGNIDYMPSHMQTITVNGGELNESCFDFMRNSRKTLQSLNCSAATNTSLADEAFKDCYNLRTLTLPQSLTSISYMAVADCKNLQSINIPASVEEIEQSAFENCRSLQTITFGGASAAPAIHGMPATTGSQLRKIGNWAFYNAHQLQNLTLPEGVEEIGDAAFYGCTYLENLTIPSSVRAIGDNCFALCSKMQRIDVAAAAPPTIHAKTFYDVNRSIPVYVPEGSENSYKADTYWKEFNIRTRPDALETIFSNSSDSSNKILHNGQILILRDGKAYDLTGKAL